MDHHIQGTFWDLPGEIRSLAVVDEKRRGCSYGPAGYRSRHNPSVANVWAMACPVLCGAEYEPTYSATRFDARSPRPAGRNADQPALLGRGHCCLEAEWLCGRECQSRCPTPRR